MRRVLALCAWLAVPSGALAQNSGYMDISGQVVASTGQPVPNCQIVLSNPDVPGSVPALTDSGGQYDFPHVPTNVKSLYYLQVRVGDRVIYNGTVQHPGNQKPIVIPAQ